jgi:anhydro-N-acetylmuramic acid kinase
MIEVDTGKPIWALGLMSGTSMDGVDAALVLTDGETISAFGAGAERPFAPGEVGFLPQIMREWSRYRPPQSDELAVELAEAQAEVDGAHAAAVGHLLSRDSVSPEVIGYHGQTIFHAPDQGWTWQLGDGAALARALNRPVVWDFRSADMQAGGEGAPLAPFFHFALAKQMRATEPVAFLNIGGVANVTWVDPSKSAPEEEGALLAFDTGPGNALINDWMSKHDREPLDRDGAEAAKGQVDEMALHSNATGAFLERKPPKSLDRNEFALALDRMADLSLEDGAATLTALTAECVAEALKHMPTPPTRWLICGGGRKNPVMMAMMAQRLGVPVDPVEAVGFDGDMLEAQAFAYLAVRSLRGLPLSAPGTTACREPVTGGRLSKP